jgi:hypothetical protein
MVNTVKQTLPLLVAEGILSLTIKCTNSMIEEAFPRWLNMVNVYGSYTAVYDTNTVSLRSYTVPYSTVIQVDVLRPYLRRVVYGVSTANIRRPYMSVFSRFLAVYSRILVVYVPYWRHIRYHVSVYSNAPLNSGRRGEFFRPSLSIRRKIYIITFK